LASIKKEKRSNWRIVKKITQLKIRAGNSKFHFNSTRYPHFAVSWSTVSRRRTSLVDVICLHNSLKIASLSQYVKLDPYTNAESLRTMEYSYLNQGGFDPTSCSLPGMDTTGLPSCSIPGAYGDLSRCAGQMSQAYGAYNTMRGPFGNPGPGPISGGPGSCSMTGMMPRPREHTQSSMFPSGKNTDTVLELLIIVECKFS
jgi:hypothetical protein